MSKIFHIKLLFFIFSGLLLAPLHIHAENQNKILKGKKTSFFDNTTNFSLMAPYKKMSKSDRDLPISGYKYIYKTFNLWLTRTLQKDFLPNDKFVYKHIKLFSSQNTGQKEDLAFLPYKINNKSFMVVQTGGIGAHIIIFLYDPIMNISDDLNQEKLRVVSLFKTYINNNISQRVTEVSMKKVQKGWLAEVKSLEKYDIINHAKCFVKNHEAFFYISKENPKAPAPARQPLPNQWFSWYKEY